MSAPGLLLGPPRVVKTAGAATNTLAVYVTRRNGRAGVKFVIAFSIRSAKESRGVYGAGTTSDRILWMQQPRVLCTCSESLDRHRAMRRKENAFPTDMCSPAHLRNLCFCPWSVCKKRRSVAIRSLALLSASAAM